MSALVTTTTLAAIRDNNTAVPSAFAAYGTSNQNIAPGNVSKEPIRGLLGNWFTGKIFCHMMGWWGKSGHITTVGYDSRNAATVQAILEDMDSRGFDGMTLAWYGQGEHSDQAFAMWKTKVEAYATNPDFTFCLRPNKDLMAKGTGTAEANLQSHLVYAAAQYCGSSRYYKVAGRPVMFFFFTKSEYDQIGTAGWERIRDAVEAVGNGIPLFYFKDKRGYGEPATDLTAANGGFSWGVANTEAYYDDFDSKSKTTAMQTNGRQLWLDANKGFNDQLASWGSGRIVSQRAGHRWLGLWDKANTYFADGVRTVDGLGVITWDDFEEGTGIAVGIANAIVITPTLSSNLLSFAVSFTDADGAEDTVSRYEIYATLDGTNVGLLGTVAVGQPKQFNLETLGLDAGNYSLYVRAVGKPCITNILSEVVEWFYDPAVPVPPGEVPTPEAERERPKVPPPPLGNLPKELEMWLIQIWRKLGSAADSADIDITGVSANITGAIDLEEQVSGRLGTVNLVRGAGLNITNNAICDSTPVDASNTTVRVYGPGGVGSAWDVFQNRVQVLSGIEAVSFTGKSYATDYYVTYDTNTHEWSITTEYKETTGDDMVRFQVRTQDSFGTVGAASSGGGGTAPGGTGGGGYGAFQ